MDLETENRIAAISFEGGSALAYLHQPTVRSRSNSRFLTATVCGVQQDDESRQDKKKKAKVGSSKRHSRKHKSKAKSKDKKKKKGR